MFELCRVATELDDSQTDYWLDVIHSAEYFTDDEFTSLKDDNDELLKLLTSILKKTKENAQKTKV